MESFSKLLETYTGWSTSDNELDGIEKYSTLSKKPDILILISGFFGNVLWVAFSMPSSSFNSILYYK
jgi:hypothetical protein